MRQPIRKQLVRPKKTKTTAPMKKESNKKLKQLCAPYIITNPLRTIILIGGHT